MGRIIGIDLGTTNSVVATVGAGGCKIIQNKEAEQMTRSVVGAYKNDFLIGTPALNRWPLAPRDTVISIKRLMGRSASDPEIESVKKSHLYEITEPSDGSREAICVKMAGEEYTPVEISAMILKKLKTDAEFALGDPVTHAVITVPAYFSEKQIDATREAGIKAGLTVMKIIDEPTAAAVAYGIDSREQEAKTILVYDLGGGTFDISVLMMSAGAYAILDREGDMWLGGDNFDQIIADYVIDCVKSEFGVDPTENHRFMATLRMETKKAKEALSSAPMATILIPGLLRDEDNDILDVDLDITRDYFVEKSRPLVAKTVALSKKALKNAHLTMEDIDYVLMAGNSTCMPMVQEAMEELFGPDKILRNIHPKNCVAMGAAMAAVVLRGIDCPKCGAVTGDLDAISCEKCGFPFTGAEQKKTCPNCGESNAQNAETCAACGAVFIKKGSVDGGNAPFSYGIQTAGDTFTVFVKKNDRYPTPENRREFQEFRTIYPNQRTVSIPVYGGDNLEKASANEKQGEAFAILPPVLPEGSIIRVKIWLDENGRFDISAQMGNGQDLNPRVVHDTGTDKRAAQRIRDIGNEIAQNQQRMAPERKKEIDRQYDELIRKFEAGEIEDANRDAERLQRSVSDISAGEATDVAQAARGVLGFAKHIADQYGWLIGQAAYTLNSMAAELEGAIAKGDAAAIEAGMHKLERAIDELCKANPTLQVFVAMTLSIFGTVSPADPVLANDLIEELGVLANAIKNNEPDASARFQAYSDKLVGILNRIEKEGNKERICHVCNAPNRPGATVCASCGATLDVLGFGGIRSITSSENPWR